MRIAIIGYGKMGHMIESIALERGHEIVCAIDRCADGAQTTLQTEHRLFSPEEGFSSEAFRSADVAIEFSTPATAQENILRAWAQGVPVVCGSTGWKVEELQFTIHNSQFTIHNSQFTIHNLDKSSFELKEVGGQKRVYLDGKLMLVWSSNYSVGVNIFFELNKELAALLQEKSEGMEAQGGCHYQPSITETHHIHKLDKPSGTAKTLAEIIQNSKIQGFKDSTIPIESIREGEVPGTHVVTWDSPEDTIVLTHIAKGRRGFALGAVLAAEELTKQNTNQDIC